MTMISRLATRTVFVTRLHPQSRHSEFVSYSTKALAVMSEAAVRHLREIMRRRNHSFPSLTYTRNYTVKCLQFSIPPHPSLSRVEDLAHRLLLCYPNFCLFRSEYDHRNQRLVMRAYV